MKRSLFTFLFLFSVLLLNAQVRVYTPALKLPEDSAINQMPDVYLSWYPVTGTLNLQYQVMMDTTPLFNSPILKDTTLVLLSGYKTRNLVFGQRYFWKVRAMDEGNTSYWSPIRSFVIFRTIDNDKPTLGDTAQMPDVELQWKEVLSGSNISGITNYDYELDTTTSFNSPIRINGSTNSSTIKYKTVNLRFGSIYYWRVRARHSKATSFWPDIWALQTSGTSANLTSVHFPTSTTGYSVGDGGTVLKSITSGKTWTTLNSGTTENLNSVYFVNGTKGWAVGDGGVIAYTSNGSSWTLQTSGTTVKLNGVHFPSTTTGFISGNDGTLLKTTDGSTWAAKTTGVTTHLRSVYFVDANTGYAVGQSGTIIKTINGGEAWIAQTSGTTNTLLSVFFLNANTGFIVGNSGTLLKTIDGGTNWSVINLGTSDDLTAVYFNNANYGHIVGKNGFFRKTIDGGKSWINPGMITTGDISWVHFMNVLNGVAVGANGSVYTTIIGGLPWNFKTVTRFVHSSPASGSLKQMLNVSITWTKYTGLLAYQYQIATDQDFMEIVAEGETTDQNTVQATFLMFGTKYYWRVRGRHLTDTSEWSIPWNYTTINTVDLKSPANNSTNISIKPAFIWTAQTGIFGYQLQLDSMQNFSTPIIDIKPASTDTIYSLNKKLENSKVYYWRMRAFSNGGLTADTTDWSPVAKFTTQGTTGIGEKGMVGFTIFPNPSSGRIFLNYSSGDQVTARFELFDLLGSLVYKQSITLTGNSSPVEIDLQNLHKGIYLARINYNGKTVNQKVIIE